jgi:hypothetical protein
MDTADMCGNKFPGFYLANLLQELGVGELPILTDIITFPDHGNLVPVTSLYVAVNSIVTNVGFTSLEPLSKTSNHNMIQNHRTISIATKC